MRPIHRKLAIGATGVAVLGAAGGAYAATHASNPANERKAFLDDAARRLHVTPQQLTNALQGAAQDRLDAAVKAGRLTQAQADALDQRVQAAPGGLPLPHLRGGFGFRLGFGPDVEMGAAAKYLGLTEAQLRSQLQGGKSLADVAKARGKSVDGLKTAIEDATRTRLDAAVKAGKLTSAEEKQILSDLSQRVDDLINGAAPRMRLHFRPKLGLGIGPFDKLGAAATYLGMTGTQLRSQLESGKSLADVAKARGKSVSGLESAIENAVRSQLDADVKAGKLTSSEEQQIVTNLHQRIDDLVNGAVPRLPFHRGFWGP